MRKFKHKNSNSIVSGDSEKGYRLETGYWVPTWIVENSNDWEEVKEYPKIVSFRNKLGGVLKILPNETYSACEESCGGLSLSMCLADKDFEIYQVATSETEIFTLGDEVRGGLGPIEVIKSFGFIKGELVIYPTNSFYEFSDVIKVKRELLFLTEDGVKVTNKNTEVKLINPITFTQAIIKAYQWDGTGKVFFFETTAKKYLDENKPVYSKKQIEEALNYGTYIFVDVELFKSRLGI